MAFDILVIDNDDTMTMLLQYLLEPEVFTVSQAVSGPGGIEAARRLNPDVVIIDLTLPDINGWEVCQAIRKFSAVPILVLSADSKPGMVAKALDEGADDYLLKPMTSSVLIAHLKRLIWRGRAERGASNTGGLNYLSA
ncbi:MAG: response regulator [Chloroflexi bacterium]|nr:response regulator [Chloroflexota bacterium]